MRFAPPPPNVQRRAFPPGPPGSQMAPQYAVGGRPLNVNRKRRRYAEKIILPEVRFGKQKGLEFKIASVPGLVSA